MWAMVQRALVPVLLLIGGAASVIYAEKFHTVPVVEVQEEEVSLPVDSPFGPGAPFPGGPFFPGGPPFGEGPPPPDGQSFPGGAPFPGGPPPFMGPPAPTIKAIRTTVVTEEESEPRLVREVTVGGVTLPRRVQKVSLWGVAFSITVPDPGEIRRTYSGGEGPALCPT